MSTLDASASWPKPSYAWTVVGLLTAAYSVAIVDRVTISLLVQPITHDLKIGDSQFGLLQGLAFSLLYSLIGFPMGMLADLWNRRWTVITGIVLWSGATMACGLTHSFLQLFAARTAVGVGEACLMPVAASLVADLFAPGARAKAYGVFVAGSTIGGGVALILGGVAISVATALIAHLPVLFGGFSPWHVVFFLTGAPGLLIAGVIAGVLREPSRKITPRQVDEAANASTLTFIRLSWRAHSSLMLGAALNLASVYAMLAWMPALFIRGHGWSASATGQLLGWSSLPLGIFTAVNSGWVLAWLTGRGHTDAPLLIASMAALGIATLGVAACLLRSDMAALTCYVATGFVINWNTAAAIAGLSQITPSRLRARVVAIYNLITGVFSMSIGAFAVGALSDTIFKGSNGTGVSLAVVFFTMSVLAAACLLSGRKDYRREAARRRTSSDPTAGFDLTRRLDEPALE